MIKNFEELYKLLQVKSLNDQSISLLLGIAPYKPSRYLSPKAVGLPIQTILGIYKHLTYKDEPILLNYASKEDLYKDRKAFRGLVGDSTSERSLGWYKGSANFTMEVYNET